MRPRPSQCSIRRTFKAAHLLSTKPGPGKSVQVAAAAGADTAAVGVEVAVGAAAGAVAIATGARFFVRGGWANLCGPLTPLHFSPRQAKICKMRAGRPW